MVENWGGSGDDDVLFCCSAGANAVAVAGDDDDVDVDVQVLACRFVVGWPKPGGGAFAGCVVVLRSIRAFIFFYSSSVFVSLLLLVPFDTCTQKWRRKKAQSIFLKTWLGIFSVFFFRLFFVVVVGFVI